MTEVFLSHHPRALADMDLAALATQGDRLLLHPGFELVWPKLPNALWRAHLYTLQYARMPDLAQAYVQFSTQENDRGLEGFLEVSERVSDGSPHHWMESLWQPNNLVPFKPNPPGP